MAFTEQDIECMSLALKLSQFGRSDVGANPMVGCVITRDDKIIAQDYHQLYGDGHAEINALNQINHEADNTKLYVTLEPCSHYGKTPPCVAALINAGVKKIFIAMLDPNPLVSGKGIKILQDAGVEVDIGLLENEAKDLNRGFIKRMQTGMPFVTSKIAMSIDGKIAMKSGESKWITSEASRNDVQILRSENQAIMTGSKTVLNDNPKMTVRLNNSKSKPLRVVIDSNNQIIDKSLNIFSSDAGTLILNNSNSEILSNGKLDLKSALRQLGKKGINTLLLEAGSGLNGAMLEAGLIDEYIIYTAPVILGSNASSMINIPLNKMSEKIELIILDIRQIGSDIKIRATLK